MATKFAQTEKTYVIMLTAVPTMARIETIAKAIGGGVADNVAVWSVAPFDITTDPSWQPIRQAILQHAIRSSLVVEQVSHSEVSAVSSQVTVLDACS